MFYKLLFLLMFSASLVMAQDLFFSEYIEGSSNNKALEIYNGTGEPVDLSLYRVYRANNGSEVWQDSLDLTGSLADGSVYVIANPSADPAILELADTTHTITFYNGDDALYLVKNIDGWIPIDVIGVLGEDPGSAWDVAGYPEATNEQTLIRKNAVTTGNTDWAAAAGTNAKDGEWRVIPRDNFSNLGTHVVGGYPIVSIRDLQYVPDPATSEESIFLNDTVVVQGMTMNGPDDIWVGARYSSFVIDPETFPAPWSGFFIIQNDTSVDVVGTQFQFIQPGVIANFTGVMTSFSGLQELAILTDPVTPIEILSAGNPIPDPLVLTAADLSNATNAEQWEGMYVTLENVTMINPQAGSDRGSITDATDSTTYISEYFQYFDDQFTAGTNPWPVAGTRFTLTGFVRSETPLYSVNPRNDDDIIILTNPPQISSLRHSPGDPTSSEAVTVSVTIIDEAPGTIASAVVKYSVDEGPFMELSMTADADTFSAEIPVQADGAFVRYFVSATDSDNETTQSPVDTSRATGEIKFYIVRDNGLSISDVQFPQGYALNNSGFLGSVVTLKGVVMTEPTDRVGDYYIQDAADAWSGMWVNDGTFEHVKGDEISVTGTVEENFGITRLNNITSSDVVNAGVGVFDPVTVTTGGFATETTEEYESVLIKVENVTVTVEFPDGYPGFGEFTINDGSGDLRVDDTFSAYSGQGADTTYKLDQTIDAINGIGYFSFGNPKLLPRNESDVVITSAIVDNEIQPVSYALDQNYPNPFNPSTSIRYQIAKAGMVELSLYDALGRKISNLVRADQVPGTYTVTFDASRLSSGVYFYKLEAGSFIKTHKMLLIK